MVGLLWGINPHATADKTLGHAGSADLYGRHVGTDLKP